MDQTQKLVELTAEDYDGPADDQVGNDNDDEDMTLHIMMSSDGDPESDGTQSCPNVEQQVALGNRH